MEQFKTEAELPTEGQKESAEVFAARKLVAMGFEQIHLDAITRVNKLGFESIMNMIEDPQTFPGAKEILEELKSGPQEQSALNKKAKEVIEKLDRL